MPLFLYRCPKTGCRVQGFSAEATSEDHHTYEPVTCPVCHQVPHVNPATGAVLEEKVEKDSLGGLCRRPRRDPRACGLLGDFLFLLRAGFDAFELKKPADAQVFAQAAARFSVFYQPSANGRLPALWRRRLQTGTPKVSVEGQHRGCAVRLPLSASAGNTPCALKLAPISGARDPWPLDDEAQAGNARPHRRSPSLSRLGLLCLSDQGLNPL